MLTVILKVTNGCNLDCAYCSLGEKPNHDIITQSMLEYILIYICEYCNLNNENVVNLILHGGEPVLVPTIIYETSLQHIGEKYPNIKFLISIQTNAFHVTDEHLRFFKKLDVAVGVSIDGSSETHNQQRKNREGGNTFNVIKNNILKMLDEEISVSCLMVLTSIGIKSSFDWLIFFEDNQLPLKINPLLNYGKVYENSYLTIKSGEYSNYLIKMFEYMLVNNIDVTISPIDKMLSAILGKYIIYECTFNPTCNYNFLCIDHLGNIYPCGKYSDIQEFCLGNVLDENLNIKKSEIMNKLYNRRNCNLPQKCKKCKYVHLCNAGCNAEASLEGNFDGAPFLCEDYKILLDYFTGNGLKLYRAKLLQRRKELIEYDKRI